MNIPKDITKTILNDAVKVWESFNKLEKLKDEKKISIQEYHKRVYVEVMKVAHLKTVMDEVEAQGVEFNEEETNFLYDLMITLSEAADIEEMNDLTREDGTIINQFVAKYNDIVPEEDYEEILGAD